MKRILGVLILICLGFVLPVMAQQQKKRSLTNDDFPVAEQKAADPKTKDETKAAKEQPAPTKSADTKPADGKEADPKATANSAKKDGDKPNPADSTTKIDTKPTANTDKTAAKPDSTTKPADKTDSKETAKSDKSDKTDSAAKSAKDDKSDKTDEKKPVPAGPPAWSVSQRSIVKLYFDGHMQGRPSAAFVCSSPGVLDVKFKDAREWQIIDQDANSDGGEYMIKVESGVPEGAKVTDVYRVNLSKQTRDPFSTDFCIKSVAKVFSKTTPAPGEPK